MSDQFDTLARKAAAGLKSTVETAELHSQTPGAGPARRLVLLRPAWIGAALLLLGSAVGVAMVLEPAAPTPTTLPPTTTTTVVTTIPPTTAAAPAPAAAIAPPAPAAALVDVQPPNLIITSPEDGATVSEKTIAFTGVTEPGADVTAGKYSAEVDSEGNWRIVLVLTEGPNLARFTARDATGNEAQASVTVTYVPATATTTKPELAEFTAYATFGSCAETPPFDHYYGTGQPGTMVHVQSEYGSKSGEVGEAGAWELEVVFEGAPPGTPFQVKVFDDFGRKFTFEFVYTP